MVVEVRAGNTRSADKIEVILFLSNVSKIRAGFRHETWEAGYAYDRCS